MLSEENGALCAVRPESENGAFTPLKLKSGFETVKNNGRKIVSSFFIMLYVSDLIGNARNYGIICSRRFDKRAVKRNRARRLLKEAVRRLDSRKMNPAMFLLIPKRSILQVKANAVAECLNKACRKAGILRQSGPSASIPVPEP